MKRMFDDYKIGDVLVLLIAGEQKFCTVENIILSPDMPWLDVMYVRVENKIYIMRCKDQKAKNSEDPIITGKA